MSTRGFITIVTGSDQYYDLAYHLLCSYRRCATANTPFAIICDRETWQAQAFDHVVLIEQPNCSYLDKLELYRYSPYDETIFIDADSLVLSDPKGLWDDFSDADDVSCYGCTYPLDSDRAWFTHDGCGKYRETVQHLIDLHGGIYYFRKSSRAKSIFEKAIEIAGEYNAYGFRHFEKPADEPVLALSLAIHHSEPCDKPARILFFPSYWGRLQVTLTGSLCVDGKEKHIEVLHFGTQNTKRFLYHYMVDCMQNVSGRSPLSLLARYILLRIQTFPTEFKTSLWHNTGRFMRKMLPDEAVNRIKNLF